MPNVNLSEQKVILQNTAKMRGKKDWLIAMHKLLLKRRLSFFKNQSDPVLYKQGRIVGSIVGSK